MLFAYPLAVFLLICVAVYLMGWTFKANGANVLVSAEVHGPAVTSPATITNIKNGQHFTKIPIMVTGTCPANSAYVEIYRNNLMSGSAICRNGTYDPMVDLFPGKNILSVNSFNITDDEGPVSNAVIVYYDAPSPPPAGTPSSSQPAGGQTATASPLVLTTSFIYKGYYIGQKLDWPLRISGGTAPYAISVNWGDGTSGVISRGAAGDFTVSHIYSSRGGYDNSYTIKVNSADSGGQKAYLQFFVIVNSQSGGGIAGNIFSKPPPSLGSSLRWLWVAWPVYLLIVAMFISYWLGEREELIILRKKGALRR